MRIGYVIWSLGLGGAEQVVMQLASGMARRGHAVMIVTLNDAGVFARRMTAQGIDVVAMGKQRRYDWSLLWRLRAVFRRHRLDVVHTHLWGANCWGRVAAWLAGVPLVVAHEHGMQPWRRRAHFLCDWGLAHLTHRIVFASRRVMEEYRANSGVPSTKCALIPNGVACDGAAGDRAALRRAFGWGADERVVVSVGRLAPEKGFGDLLRAFQQVAAAGAVRLVIIGDGPEREALVRLKRECRLDGAVQFAGMQEDVRRWLAAADLYVQPSHREGLPLAILEAMALGLPVVATRVGDVGALIRDGQEGYLVEPQRPEALAGVLRLVLQRLDRQRPVIEAARRVVAERYALDHMVTSVESLYEKHLNVAASRRSWLRPTPHVYR